MAGYTEFVEPGFYLSVLNAVDTILVVLRPDGRIAALNRACEKVTGYPHEDLIDKPIWDTLLTGSDADTIRAAFKWLNADWFPNTSDYTWTTRAGKQRIIHLTQNAVLSESGALRYIVCAGADVTHTRETERTIQENLLRYQTIVDRMLGALVVKDQAGQITYINEQFCRLLGYGRSQLLGLNFAELVALEWHDALEEHNPRQQMGESASYELGFNHHNGQIVSVLVSSSPIIDSGGRFRGSFDLCTDISPYKQSEQALRDSNEELDAFAHTVAHDLKDPLSVLTGFATLVEKDFLTMSEKELKDYLQIMTHTGDKMINIIDELLLLSRMRHIDKVQMHVLDTGAIIDNVLMRLGFMIEQYHAELYWPDSRDWPHALGYDSWIEEVWVNYISNAIKYGGQPPRVELGATQLKNGKVRFWVKDNGRGIAPENRAQIFMPFTRLDQVRVKGHGLGLSIVQRIIHKLGGEVGFESEVGAGSVFSFTLPAENS